MKTHFGAPFLNAGKRASTPHDWDWLTTRPIDGQFDPTPPDTAKYCSYCHSSTIEDTIKCLENEQTRDVEFADFKYGYPHKLYYTEITEPYSKISSSRSYTNSNTGEQVTELGEPQTFNTRTRKFYTEHLIDASSEELEQFNAALLKRGMRIKFAITENRLQWGRI